MEIFILNIIIIAIFDIQGYSQLNKFKWTFDDATYEGTYDKSKINQEKLKNTFKLGLSDYFDIQYSLLSIKISDLNNLNTKSIDKEYLLKSNELRNLIIVNTPYWNNYKKNKLIELNQTYTIKKYLLRGFQNPKLLRNLKLGNDCKNKYLPALISGGSNLLILWKEIINEQIKISGMPKRLQNEYNIQYSSPDKYKYARIEVMIFGLSICFNKYIHYTNNIDNNLNFKKLFLKVNIILPKN
jgi:hypothetical protein